MDNAVGPAGCFALGEALMLGANKSLLTLRLDNNITIGDAGIRELCKGLRTNKSLKKLTVSYCDIGPDGGGYLSSVLAYPGNALAHLDLMGNHIGSEGLLPLAVALQGNTALQELIICDNKIGASADADINAAALTKLGEALTSEVASVCRVDMEMNTLLPSDAELLVPALAPVRRVVSCRVVSCSVSLCRCVVASLSYPFTWRGADQHQGAAVQAG